MAADLVAVLEGDHQARLHLSGTLGHTFGNGVRVVFGRGAELPRPTGHLIDAELAACPGLSQEHTGVRARLRERTCPDPNR